MFHWPLLMHFTSILYRILFSQQLVDLHSPQIFMTWNCWDTWTAWQMTGDNIDQGSPVRYPSVVVYSSLVAHLFCCIDLLWLLLVFFIYIIPFHLFLRLPHFHYLFFHLHALHSFIIIFSKHIIHIFSEFWSTANQVIRHWGNIDKTDICSCIYLFIWSLLPHSWWSTVFFCHGFLILVH